MTKPDSATDALREWLNEQIETDSEIAKTEDEWGYWSGRWDALDLVQKKLTALLAKAEEKA